MSVRPRLKNHVRPLRRSAHAIQFGLAPDAGVVVEGLTDAEIDLLLHLDGSMDTAQLHAAARRAGVPVDRVERILAELRRHRLLVDDPTDRADLVRLADRAAHEQRHNADGLALAYQLAGDGWAQLAARREQYVLIGASGGFAETVARLLRAGGIGRVEVGQTRFDAAVHAFSARQEPVGPPTAPPTPDAPEAPDLVLLPATGALPPGAGALWWRHRIPHLPVVAQGHRVVLGPLILPGHGPCLDCLDLHRRDRDPAWPALLNQLAPPLPGPRQPVELETTLGASAAGLVAMAVHGHLDGLALPTGVCLELSLPWPWLVHREWTSHPACTCAA